MIGVHPQEISGRITYLDKTSELPKDGALVLGPGPRPGEFQIGFFYGDDRFPYETMMMFSREPNAGTEDSQPVICGRKKDILIISGRNVHPEDIERSVIGVTGVRSGSVAAVRFSTAAPGEGFSMVAESPLHADSAQSARIRTEIADRIYRKLGLSPRAVHVVPAGWIPKTSSGKLRRLETSERLRGCGHSR